MLVPMATTSYDAPGRRVVADCKRWLCHGVRVGDGGLLGGERDHTLGTAGWGVARLAALGGGTA